MDLYLSLENNKLRNLHEDFRDEVWLAFHQGEVNDQDEFYTYFHEYIDNAVIYTSDCEAILSGNRNIIMKTMTYMADQIIYLKLRMLAYMITLWIILIHQHWEQMETVLNEE